MVLVMDMNIQEGQQALEVCQSELYQKKNLCSHLKFSLQNFKRLIF